MSKDVERHVPTRIRSFHPISQNDESSRNKKRNVSPRKRMVESHSVGSGLETECVTSLVGHRGVVDLG